LKILIEYVLEQTQALGRPATALRELYDLPAVGLEFRNFEISFGAPTRNDQGFFEEVAGSERAENDRIYERVKALLAKGLKPPLQLLLFPEDVGDDIE
jgi:hypothetical protein